MCPSTDNNVFKNIIYPVYPQVHILKISFCQNTSFSRIFLIFYKKVKKKLLTGCVVLGGFLGTTALFLLTALAPLLEAAVERFWCAALASIFFL